MKSSQLVKLYLDCGCGTGSLINYLTTYDFNTTGIEPDQNARNQIPTELNIYSSIEDLKGDQHFDTITLYVLEHVHEPVATLNKLLEKLSDDGAMHIALPNYQSYDAQYYGAYWAEYDVPRHLFHYSQNAFQSLCSQLNLQIVDTLPLKFDSYYVSLLSEQYKI